MCVYAYICMYKSIDIKMYTHIYRYINSRDKTLKTFGHF